MILAVIGTLSRSVLAWGLQGIFVGIREGIR